MNRLDECQSWPRPFHPLISGVSLVSVFGHRALGRAQSGASICPLNLFLPSFPFTPLKASSWLLMHVRGSLASPRGGCAGQAQVSLLPSQRQDFKRECGVHSWLSYRGLGHALRTATPCRWGSVGWELPRRSEEASFGSQKNWSLDMGCPFVSQTGGLPRGHPGKAGGQASGARMQAQSVGV